MNIYVTHKIIMNINNNNLDHPIILFFINNINVDYKVEILGHQEMVLFFLLKRHLAFKK